MGHGTFGATWLGALALGLACAGAAAAQQGGDRGRDAGGNVYTYIVGADGIGRWHPGRVATGPERTIVAERYTPTIWVDPDGCEHWVLDDGFEGFMSPHLDRHGRPVCRGAN